MSIITKHTKSIKPIVSQPNLKIQPLTATQLPGSIIKNISSFTSYQDLTHNVHSVCKEWQNILPEDGILNLQNSPITDQELLDLIARYKKPLKSINLFNCLNITDKGIEHLSKLKNLKKLDLTKCKNITDAGIKHLVHLQKLTDLTLIHCPKISDKSAKSLSKLQSLQSLNLRGCTITDLGVKELIKLRGLETLNLRGCPITDAGAKDLSTLNRLVNLDLTMCSALTGKSFDHLFLLPNLKKLNQRDLTHFDPFKRISTEKAAIKQFIYNKCQELNLPYHEPRYATELYGMEIRHRDLQIFIDSLYLLVEKDIDAFLEQKPQHRESIKLFLSQKNPQLLKKAATDLITWCDDVKGLGRLSFSEHNKTTAAEILIMHATGNLSASKRFLLTHEIGHGYDQYWLRTKSLGSFNPRELNFIKPHQFPEVRADLTGARLENLHKVAIAFFEWASILAKQPSESDVHPIDKNRAKAIKMDYDHILQSKKTNLEHRHNNTFVWRRIQH